MKNQFEKKKNERAPGGSPRPFRGERPARETFSEEDRSLIGGRNAVKELFSSGRDIEKIYVQRGEREGSIRLLIGMATEQKIPVIEVERQKLDRMLPDTRHQGIVAAVAEAEYASLDDAFALAEERGEAPFFVMCDGVEDPHNLGAVIRSAECCGAHAVIIPKRRSAGLTAVVAKTSAGALAHLPVVRVPNLTACAEELKERGVWLYAADMGGEDLFSTDLSGSVCVVLGNEGEGISRLLKEHCDFTVSIPLYGKVDSMNVSCAAAVILAETAHQKHRRN